MNNSSSEAAPFDLEPTFSYSVATCYIVIPLVAIVGNLLVCYAILTNRELRDNPTNLLLLSLAISDLLTVTLDALFDVEALFLHGLWKHWKALCITWLTVYLITVPSSVLTLLAISVDRYNTIRDHLARFRRSHFTTKKRAVTISLLVWVYCIVWSLLPIIGWRDRNEEPVFEGAYMTPYTKVYSTLRSLINFILPLLVTCLFYILIYRISRNHGPKFGNNGGLPSAKQPTIDEKRCIWRTSEQQDYFNVRRGYLLLLAAILVFQHRRKLGRLNAISLRTF